jgi:hypothetical protein
MSLPVMLVFNVVRLAVVLADGLGRLPVDDFAYLQVALLPT